jgi:hypothetical protein
VAQQDRGVRIDLVNAPAMAFVDGEIIRGVAELLFAVVRDLAYMAIEMGPAYAAELESSEGITNAVFGLLRNARILNPGDPNLVVCWGGHSISRDEYLYTKQVGYELGLRGLDICTGCGPGAMKGPMKGATIAHAKQRRTVTRYIGLTEPGIIAAESPNPIVNHLVIMPDIEKRLRPSSASATASSCSPVASAPPRKLYLLGILLREEKDLPFPLILTGPTVAAPYFEQIDRHPPDPGDEAAERYEIIIGDPVAVARRWPGRHQARARTAWRRRTRSSSTGRSRFRGSTSSRSCRPTRRWPRWTCTTARGARAGGRSAARSRASSPATSRTTACAGSSNSARSRSTATRR